LTTGVLGWYSGDVPLPRPTSTPETSPRYQTTRDLSAAQLWLLRTMSERQFGRIEHLEVQRGQPAPGPAMKVVRVAHLGGGSDGAKVPHGEEFELKQAVRDLFAELGRLNNGTVVRLELKRGLPCLLETTANGAL
jgi:hypothetical protein